MDVTSIMGTPGSTATSETSSSGPILLIQEAHTDLFPTDNLSTGGAEPRPDIVLPIELVARPPPWIPAYRGVGGEQYCLPHRGTGGGMGLVSSYWSTADLTDEHRAILISYLT